MFSYKNGEIYVEDVPVNKIADQVGTPCYVYSYKFIEDTYNEYKKAFSQIEPIICFSAKANSNLSILKAFSSLGSGFDIVSVGELKKALLIGADPKKIVFSGVGKTNILMRACEDKFIPSHLMTIGNKKNKKRC